MSLSKYKLGELIENCHTDLFVANATHRKEKRMLLDLNHFVVKKRRKHYVSV